MDRRRFFRGLFGAAGALAVAPFVKAEPKLRWLVDDLKANPQWRETVDFYESDFGTVQPGKHWDSVVMDDVTSEVRLNSKLEAAWRKCYVPDPPDPTAYRRKFLESA